MKWQKNAFYVCCLPTRRAAPCLVLSILEQTQDLVISEQEHPAAESTRTQRRVLRSAAARPKASATCRCVPVPGLIPAPQPVSHSFWSIFTRLPPYSGSSTLSPSLTLMGIRSPSLLRLPGPTASTTPSFTCSTACGYGTIAWAQRDQCGYGHQTWAVVGMARCASTQVFARNAAADRSA